ncbi:hypothetical protein G8A07_27265 [Roseateles sp. DAIF2]|uniref:hypothetical protein n=1 Tax=Roseateles sp. DAIF2 TaxID=2714952 RepID=UPI0018A33966|nr:hypothetical protein [Roseateles sp. DAIF2]QPF76265.1 hypothetical protein G8A07_27265 [Roseateles sp. DAIF2]
MVIRSTGSPLGALALAALLIAAPLRAQEPVAPAPAAGITWITPDFSLGSGAALSHKTMVGPLLDYLGAQWNVPQRVLLANAKRSWSLLRAGENVCHLVSLRTPERESQAFFVNTHLVPPLQLVTHRQALALLPLNAAGEVELERLWRQQRLKGALIEGRSYGAQLDQLLAQRPPGAMESHVPGDFGMRVLQLVAAGRADYTLDYDFSLQQQKDWFPALQDLVTVPLQGQSEPQISGIACPRNAWGARVAQRLRQLLATPAGIAALKASFDPALTPQTRARYGARIAAYYDQLPAELLRGPALAALDAPP